MKKRNKIIIAISVILLISLYGFNINSTTDTSFVTKVENTPWNDDLDKKLRSMDINTLNYTSNTAIPHESNIKASFVIDDFNVGLARYIPYYKNVSYSSKIIYEWSANVSKDNKDSLLNNKGQLEIEGRTIIRGICSASHAKEIIKKNIHQKIKDELQREIDNQINAIQ